MTEKGLLIDYDWCTGCHSCEMACQMEHGYPVDRYGIKVQEIGPWHVDEKRWILDYIPGITPLCDMCKSRTESGKMPACVHHCQSKCLSFVTLDEARENLNRGNRKAFFSHGSPGSR